MILLQELKEPMITFIYQNHMVKDFPSEELKPLSSILQLHQKGVYSCYGLYKENTLLAYAFFGKPDVSSDTCVLLDFYAVCSEYRDSGYGSRFLTILKETCQSYLGIIAEVEDPEKASNEKERKKRERRIAFYERNGFILTSVIGILFGVQFRIYVYPECRNSVTDQKVYHDLDSIYHTFLSDGLYHANVQLSIINGETVSF